MTRRSVLEAFLSTAGLCIGAVVLPAGCGDSGSDGKSTAQLSADRQKQLDAEEKASAEAAKAQSKKK